MHLGSPCFAGMPVFASGQCARCSEDYLLDLPAGHALLHPALIQCRTGAVFHDGLDWYPKALLRIIQSRKSPKSADIFLRSGPRVHRRAVLVNCLDTIYGHALLKLLSSLRFIKERPEFDLVYVIPKSLSWLVPAEARAVFEVDLNFSEFGRWISKLDAAIGQVLVEYESAFLAEAVSQPDLRTADLSLLGPEFKRRPLWQSREGPAQLIISVRNDGRLWIGSERLVHAIRRRRLLVRMRVPQLLVRYQNMKFGRVAKRLKKLIPELRVVVVGLGKTGRFPDCVVDMRESSVTPEIERRWCLEFSRSDVVLGVHGSHLLLPSALAAAVVELLPPSKLRNITQDLIVASEPEPKLCLFRYRIYGTQTGPEMIVRTIVSILRDADMHFLNIIGNRATLTHAGWTRAVNWRRLDRKELPVVALPPESGAATVAQTKTLSGR
jgi:hypothetical protein